jgi:hypothetical protein
MRVSMAAIPLWAVASGMVALALGAERGPDPIIDLEAECATLALVTPGSGPVGFLDHHGSPDALEHVRAYYVVQYAFAPRLVLRQTDLEFIVVLPEALRPGGDDRLDGFERVTGSPDGPRLYRRVE